MEFTQEQLESMSNLEINHIVAKIKGDLIDVPFGFEGFICGDKHCYYDDLRGIWGCHPDYCHDWSECGILIDELIIENKIVISIKKRNLMFTSASDAFNMKHEDIKRAVTIVYILVKQSNG